MPRSCWNAAEDPAKICQEAGLPSPEEEEEGEETGAFAGLEAAMAREGEGAAAHLVAGPSGASTSLSHDGYEWKCVKLAIQLRAPPAGKIRLKR